MFSTIINDLIDSGFIIEKIIEPVISEELITKYPEYIDNYHRPDFLLIKASKKD